MSISCPSSAIADSHLLFCLRVKSKTLVSDSFMGQERRFGSSFCRMEEGTFYDHHCGTRLKLAYYPTYDQLERAVCGQQCSTL